MNYNFQNLVNQNNHVNNANILSIKENTDVFYKKIKNDLIWESSNKKSVVITIYATPMIVTYEEDSNKFAYVVREHSPNLDLTDQWGNSGEQKYQDELNKLYEAFKKGYKIIIKYQFNYPKYDDIYERCRGVGKYMYPKYFNRNTEGYHDDVYYFPYEIFIAETQTEISPSGMVFLFYERAFSTRWDSYAYQAEIERFPRSGLGSGGGGYIIQPNYEPSGSSTFVNFKARVDYYGGADMI